MAKKIEKHFENLNVPKKRPHTGGGGSEGSEGEMVRDHTFPLFLIESFPYRAVFDHIAFFLK